MLTRSEVLANRRKVIKFLKNPRRKKARGYLDIGGGARCCLGHACYALGIKRESISPSGAIFIYGEERASALAPQELIDSVGLYFDDGGPKAGTVMRLRVKGTEEADTSLAQLNDATDATPQEIGALLERMIEGGPHTPWKPLNEYEEK